MFFGELFEDFLVDYREPTNKKTTRRWFQPIWKNITLPETNVAPENEWLED